MDQALVSAVSRADLNVARLLLKAGARPSSSASDGRTCVELARDRRQNELLQLLLAYEHVEL